MRASQSTQRVHLLLLAGMSLLLAACGATTPTINRAATATAGAVATGTAAAQATKAATPVLLALQVSQRGTLAAHNVRLIMTVTVTNQTGAPIHLVQHNCTPVFVVTLSDTSGRELLNNRPINCPGPAPSFDRQTVAAGASWSRTLDDSDNYYDDVSYITSLRAGIPYTITVDLLEWHQGALDASGHPLPGELKGQDVIASAQYTFQ